MDHEIPFGADVTKPNNQLTDKVPDCMQNLPSDPSRKPLKKEELQNAKEYLIHKDYTKLSFPRKSKFRIDPSIPGQFMGLLSFIPSSGSTPDAEGCFGVVKFRGAFSTEKEADQYAEMLLREHDSFADIDYVLIGRDFPLMKDNSMYVKETREVDVRKKVEETVKEHVANKREEERKQIETIEKRQAELLNPSTEDLKEKSITTLDYYIELRVKKAHALMTIKEAEKRIEEAKKVVEEAQKDISDLDNSNPEYKEKYLEQYKNALNEVGADVASNPIVKYMKDE
jgi:hypothetical protein